MHPDSKNMNKYLELYLSDNKSLNEVLAGMQSQLNSHFKEINSRLKKGRYTAEPSRNLIAIINEIFYLINNLKGTEYEVNLIDEYKVIVDVCEDFLQLSEGSDFPSDFTKINVLEIKSVFEFGSKMTIKRPNDILFNLKSIGSGSYVSVHKYKDQFYGKYYAVKKANKNLNSKELERFKREFDVMSQLNSPYVIEVYNYNDEKNEYVMEYADYTLKEYIEKKNSKLLFSERANIARQILRAFEYIHSKGHLHRDISYSNVLLKDYDGLLVVKISDFGLVKIRESSLTSLKTEFKGSLNDPKLEVRGEFKDYKDIHETYALTRLLYFVLTGRKNIMNESDKDFLAFYDKGISDNHQDRYQNVNEIKSEVEGIIRIKL